MTAEMQRCSSAARQTARILALMLAYGVPVLILLCAALFYLLSLAFGEMLAYDATMGMTEAAAAKMAITGPWRPLRPAETQPSTYGGDILVDVVPPERLQARDCEMYVDWRLYHVRFLQLRDSAGEFPTAVARRIVIERNRAAAVYVPALLIGLAVAWFYLVNRLRRLTAPRCPEGGQRI